MVEANLPESAQAEAGGLPPSIQVTFDLYGHLMPGSEAEAAALLDAYLTAQRKRSEDTARGLTGAPTGAPVAHSKV
jgi:hypothetical protein